MLIYCTLIKSKPLTDVAMLLWISVSFCLITHRHGNNLSLIALSFKIWPWHSREYLSLLSLSLFILLEIVHRRIDNWHCFSFVISGWLICIACKMCIFLFCFCFFNYKPNGFEFWLWSLSYKTRPLDITSWTQEIEWLTLKFQFSLSIFFNYFWIIMAAILWGFIPCKTFHNVSYIS